VITVVVPVSPIKSHPETTIIEETLDSVRHHLPDAEIILTCDGVRREQEGRRADYEEHLRRLVWLADHKYGHTLPIIFDDHRHQTGMMRSMIDEIQTPPPASSRTHRTPRTPPTPTSPATIWKTHRRTCSMATWGKCKPKGSGKGKRGGSKK
jgi:hypothetical protein